jgi:hypothetical protein
MKLSIVSPVYKAKTIVPELVRRIVESVSKITDDLYVFKESRIKQNGRLYVFR